jgi:CRISPR-associated endonuclease/helicase Cas3
MPPETLLYRLWAKTNERAKDATPEAWTRHPLPCHLLDVGLAAEGWLDTDPRLMARFADLWPEADAGDLRRALVLTAAVHDLGKVYPDFQVKSERGWTHGYGAVWTGERPSGKGFDHGAGTARIFGALLTGRYGVAEGVDLAWKTLGALIRAGAGHHGTLYADEAVRADLNARNHPMWSPLVRAALDEVVHAFGPVPALPDEPPPALLMLTAGFVSVADWFGSNTDSFPAAPDVTGRAEADAYVALHRENRTAERALREAGLVAETRAPETFEDLFGGWSPRPGFQSAACAIPFGQTLGREIAIVEAPMGLGKTEIALFLAAQALRHQTAAGLYAALPTQATANALFERVRRFADRVRADDDDLALVLAHGASRYYPEYRVPSKGVLLRVRA